MSALNDDWGGDDLDLTENKVNEGLPILKTGVYDALSADVENKKSKGGKMLTVTFKDVNGTGQIRFNFNYKNASEDAQRIGRDQLKTFLTHGGHPQPDKPFDHPKEKMEGLKVRIFVEEDGSYVKDNKTYVNYAIKRFALVEGNPAPGATGGSPSLTGGSAATRTSSAGSASRDLDDDIPF